MSQISVDTSRCKRDGVCVAACPSGFLTRDAEGRPAEVEGGVCILCGHCVAICAHDALIHAGLPREEFLPAASELPAPALLDGFLLSRRSVREFRKRSVARETLKELLDVARRAPTASNTQKLHWIVVEGPEKVHALAAEIVNWTQTSGRYPFMLERWEKGADPALRGAPTVVVACAPKDYGWGAEDAAIALSYLELAAEARGLGVCWAGYLTRIANQYAPLRQVARGA